MKGIKADSTGRLSWYPSVSMAYYQGLCFDPVSAQTEVVISGRLAQAYAPSNHPALVLN